MHEMPAPLLSLSGAECYRVEELLLSAKTMWCCHRVVCGPSHASELASQAGCAQNGRRKRRSGKAPAHICPEFRVDAISDEGLCIAKYTFGFLTPYHLIFLFWFSLSFRAVAFF